MENILLTVSYDGTDFCGWQRQDKADYGNPVRTVQGEIEKALKKMFGKDINLYGSGRTDSGVHARGQAANFTAPADNIPECNYIRALNGMLPPDIRILQAKKVPDEFNSRFSATSRKYRYFISTAPAVPADKSRYVWCISRDVNLETLNAMTSCLKGETDCATFAAAGDQSKSTKRYIDSARFYRQDEETIVFEIEANAFLWKMVRSLTGTLISGEKKGLGKDWFASILESRQRSNSLFTAPPQGLFLWEVKFDGIRRHV
ncbi:tRNA pseudouridine(38-40) synthase TruA [Treponema sp.]|uniref:tRNA pseudouridine(38-40) synthase TruA n=1 Tax=Treponema sp. TaxID=166 RepID=UPI0025EED360|nr:tRNA pseudouridine(38-40) synthase TruA [Treponema sp.]MCR5218116.1 tRNA pseudouridine(38-40) synthase TruA [Treponema sp.]